MAEQDSVLGLALESAQQVLHRRQEPSWLQLFVRVAYAYEEMTASVQPAHSRAFFAQSNPEVFVRLLSSWLESQPDLSSPGLAAALDALRAQLDVSPAAVAAVGAPPRRAASPIAMLEGALTSGELAERLGVTRQAINQRRGRRQLLGFKRGREFLYPLWQLDRAGAPLVGLSEVLLALGEGRAEHHATFLLTGHAGLEGATPLSCLQSGRLGEVLALLA